MRDLYIKRNELNQISQNLKTAKFDESLSREQVSHLVGTQKDVYQRYKFYDNYIKIGGKLRGKKICSKER